MNDRILITGLVVDARIGVTQEERAEPQPLVIDIELAVDLSTAGETDDLRDTIDYDDLTTSVANLVRQSECRLLERLASQIGDQVSALRGVRGVTVSVMKKQVPVEEEVGGIAISISRGEI